MEKEGQSTLDQILTLEKDSSGAFIARHHQPNFRHTLFGGQVLAQGLMAAGQTADRPVNSLHAYFLRPGRTDLPVIYHVKELRSGRSVITREVEAEQDGKMILTMQCSFHLVEEGYYHQSHQAPPVPTPEALLTSLTASEKQELESASHTLGTSSMEFIPCQKEFFTSNAPTSADVQFWMRVKDCYDAQPLQHACALAFASDIGLLATTLMPHDTSLFSGKVLPASMDHSIWYHQTCDFREWHLYSATSPWAGNARGLALGAIYNQLGELVASTAQEGLIRPIRPNA